MKGRMLGIAASAALAVMAALAFRAAIASQPSQVLRYECELPELQHLNTEYGLPILAVSPSGKQLVYSTAEGLYLCRPEYSKSGSKKLWNDLSYSKLVSFLLFETAGAALRPFFSRDGKWVGYYSAEDQKLKKIGIPVGMPVTLCDAAAVAGVYWAADNKILFGLIDAKNGGGIMRVSDSGGVPEMLVPAESGQAIFPQILPDGKTLLYTAGSPDRPNIVVKPMKSGEPRVLFEGTDAWYLATGHILYRSASSDSVFAVPFNLERLELAGKPVPVIEHVLGSGVQYAVSESGTLAYLSGDPDAGKAGRFTLVWVDREGREEPLPAEPNLYSCPRISPDGNRLALAVNTDGK